MFVRCAMRRAFTMIELLLVVVFIAIMAGFFMPGFGKTISRAKASDAIGNLSLICGANAIYKSKHGFNFAPTGSVTVLGTINTGLGVNIMPNGLAYSCGSGACTAVSGSDFTIGVDLNAGVSASNPSCTTGTNCP